MQRMIQHIHFSCLCPHMGHIHGFEKVGRSSNNTGATQIPTAAKHLMNRKFEPALSALVAIHFEGASMSSLRDGTQADSRSHSSCIQVHNAVCILNLGRFSDGHEATHTPSPLLRICVCTLFQG